MIWFSWMNLLRERKQVPKFCRYIVLNYVCYLMCIEVCPKKKKTYQDSASNLEKKTICSVYEENSFKQINKHNQQIINNLVENLSYSQMQTFVSSQTNIAGLPKVKTHNKKISDTNHPKNQFDNKKTKTSNTTTDENRKNIIVNMKFKNPSESGNLCLILILLIQ